MDHPYTFYATQMKAALEQFTEPYVRACKDVEVRRAWHSPLPLRRARNLR